jgi:LysM repeat protein
MIQGSVEEFAKTPKGQEFLGWGWDGQEVVEIDGQVYPAMDGVRMYDADFGDISSMISNLLSAQPEAPRQRETTGAPIATNQTMDEGDDTWEGVDVEGNLSQMGNNVNAAPYASQPGGSYRIKQGDTLWDIAQQYNTTVDDLMRANPNIQDRDRIMAGGMLNVPELADDPANIANQIDPQANAMAQQLGSGADLSPPQSPRAEWDNWSGRIPTAAPTTVPPTTAPVAKSYGNAPSATVSLTNAPQTAPARSTIANLIRSGGQPPSATVSLGSDGTVIPTSPAPRKPTYVAPHMAKRQRQQAVYDFE